MTGTVAKTGPGLAAKSGALGGGKAGTIEICDGFIGLIGEVDFATSIRAALDIRRVVLAKP